MLGDEESMERLDTNTIINVHLLDKVCFKCKKEFDYKNVELQHRGVSSLTWQKEKLGYCVECNMYYVSIFQKDVFEIKYPDYSFVEENEKIHKQLPSQSSEPLPKIKAYILTKKNKHARCGGVLRKDPYIKESICVVGSNGERIKFTLNKCPLCEQYFVNNAQAKEIKKKYNNVEFITLYNENSRNTVLKSFSSYQVLHLSDKVNVVYDNKCLNNHRITNKTFKVSVNCGDNMNVIKTFNGYYCSDCGMYIIDQDEFDRVAGDRIPNCDLYVNYKKFNGVMKKKTDVPIEHSVDFFVRTNVIGCIKERHSIESLIAEIDVIDKLGNVVKKSIPAYYCRECDLYFIYNHDYERIKNTGIPLCQIYEYTKYIKGLDNEYNLLRNYLGFTDDDILRFNLNAIDAAFISEEEKQDLRNRLLEK